MAFRLSKYRDIHFNDIDGTGVFELTTTVYCDTVSDLPGADDIKNFRLALGCKAIIVDTGERYYLGSDGQWYNDESSGGGSEPVLIEKEITENGTYTASDDSADGYSAVTVEVPNSYTAGDDGKVVSNGALVSQTSRSISSNATYDTTTNNSVTVNVPNTYSSSDNGKVVSNGVLVSQTAKPTTITENDTYDTTYYNSVTVNVSGGGGSGNATLEPESGSTSFSYSNDYMSMLTSIDIPNGVESIDPECFSECSRLASVTIPDSVTSIGSNAFAGCNSLTSVTIPSSVTNIEYNAFYQCESLNNITIPDSVEQIGEAAFSGCTSLTSITIPSSVASIEEQCFQNCSGLIDATIQSGVDQIGNYAFSGCTSLTSITIPDSVANILDYAFYQCTSLTSITIPDSIEYLGTNVLYECSSLETLTFASSTPPELYGDLGIETTCIIRVPQGSLSDYTSAENYPDPSIYTYIEY